MNLLISNSKRLFLSIRVLASQPPSRLLDGFGRLLEKDDFWTAVYYIDTFWTAVYYIDTFWTAVYYIDTFWTAVYYIDTFWTAK